MQLANAFHISDPDEVEFRNGLDCLTYLGLDDFTQLEPLGFIERSSWIWRESDSRYTYYRPATDIKQGRSEIAKRFKFLSYAISNWQHHLHGRDKHPVTIFYFLPTLTANSNIFKWYPWCPPLQYLWDWNLRGLMTELVSRGHNINERNELGEPLLHSRGGKITVDQMDFLLGLGAKINGRDKKGQTLLSRLVRYGNIEAIGRIIRQPGLDITARDQYQQNALHAAAACPQEHIESVIEQLLLVPGIEPDAEDNEGRTPLMLLMQWGFERGVRKLLSYPSVKVTGSQTSDIEESPLISAAQQGWCDVVLYIIQKLETIDEYSDQCGATIFHWAIFMDMKDVLKVALTKQTNLINRVDKRRMTPLHYPAKQGDLEAVNSLLANEAFTSLRNHSGATPCHLAAASGHQRVLERLVKSAPAFIINQRDHNGWTILHWALTSGEDNLVRFLLSQPEINLSIGEKIGRQPILLAAGYSSVHVLQDFIEKSPNGVHTVDKFGYSLLHMAVAFANLPNIAYLTSLDVWYMTCRNVWGRHPLDYAPNKAIEDQLLQQGFEHSMRWDMEHSRRWDIEQAGTKFSSSGNLRLRRIVTLRVSFRLALDSLGNGP